MSAAALRARALPLGLAVLGLAGWVSARRLELWTEDGPGSGLLPKTALAIVTILALLVALAPGEPDAPADEASTPRVFAIYAGAAIGLAAAVPYLGFILPTLVATAVILRVAEERSWFASLLYALCLVGTIVLTFGTALKVQFPDGPAEALLKSMRLL